MEKLHNSMSSFIDYLNASNIAYQLIDDLIAIPQYELESESIALQVSKDPINGHLLFTVDADCSILPMHTVDVLRILNHINRGNPMGKLFLDETDDTVRMTRELRVGSGMSIREYQEFLNETHSAFIGYSAVIQLIGSGKISAADGILYIETI